MNKYFSYCCVILLLGIFLGLCFLYAMQYNSTCQSAITYHIFDLLKVLFEFIHNVIKDFSWAFLILLLFFLPHCMENINVLIEKAGEIVANYGKAIKIESQTAGEKKDFQKEQNTTLSENSCRSNRSNDFKERREKYNKLKDFSDQFIKNNNDDFIKNSKLIYNNDPVLTSGSLLFDCSYRCGIRRYINTLYVNDTALFSMEDKIYKYLRIMYDINKSRKNQRYAMEIIVLSTDDQYSGNLFSKLRELYQEPLERGVFALKEFKFEDGKPKQTNKTGWILD